MRMSLVFVCLAGLWAGCSTDPSTEKVSQTPQFGQPQSSIPWNKPESWEQAGALGSVPGISGTGSAR